MPNIVKNLNKALIFELHFEISTAFKLH